MSASPRSDAAALVDEDANALDAGVWPASAHRDQHGELSIGGVAASALLERFGSPLYVMDEDEVRAHARRVRAAFEVAAAGTQVYYASKALLTTAIARWVVEEGLGLDVASGGELAVALAAGVDPARIAFHGNNKSVAELEQAVTAGVGLIVVDSAIEIERLAPIAARHSIRQSVLVRVTTGVHADTHAFLATAHEDQKFGLDTDAATAAVARIRALPSLEFRGLHSHIGSQIFGADGFREAASRLVDLYADLLRSGPVAVLDLGGGFGIAYTTDDDPTPIEQLAADVVEAVTVECAVRGVPVPTLMVEPGRAIVGQAGVTLYTVGTVKPVRIADDLERVYVSVDGGMSDNPRFALYGAQYTARIASRASDAEPAVSRVVGKHCESGDIVVDRVMLPGDIAPDDLLAVPVTGAYCHALSSTYNHVPRAAMVAVKDGEATLLIRRETEADLLARDLGVGT